MIPPFTTLDEEARVLVESSLAWRAEGEEGEPLSLEEVVRRARIYERWSAVYAATSAQLRVRAAMLEKAMLEKAVVVAAKTSPKPAAQKPLKPASTTPAEVRQRPRRGNSKNGPVRHINPSAVSGGKPATFQAPSSIAPKVVLPKPPPLARIDY